MVKPSENNQGKSDPPPSKEPQERLLKFVLVGESHSGKTALVYRYSRDLFHQTFVTTIGVDFAMRKVQVANGDSAKLQIWDTAGQERFRNISMSFYRGAHGVIVVYDVTDKKSYNGVTLWLEEVAKHCSSEVAFAIVGTKLDLKGPGYDYYGVDTLKGISVPAGVNLIGFFEVSSSTGHGVEELFQTLADTVVDQQLQRENPIRVAATIHSAPETEGSKENKNVQRSTPQRVTWKM